MLMDKRRWRGVAIGLAVFLAAVLVVTLMTGLFV